MKHLLAQDEELLRHARMLESLLEKNGISFQQLAADGTTTSHLDAYLQAAPAADAPATPVPGKDAK